MKSLLVLLLVLSSTISSAAEFRFSAYSCHFQRMVKDNMWFPPMMGFGRYDNVLGWNQTTHITKSTSKTETSEIGICGSIHSTIPEYINLTVHFVSGSELEMNGEGCMYSGKNIAFESSHKEVTSLGDYHIARKTITTEHGDMEHIAVIGIRGTFEDFPREECMKAFEEVAGQPFNSVVTKNSLTRTNFKKLKGQVLK